MKTVKILILAVVFAALYGTAEARCGHPDSVLVHKREHVDLRNEVLRLQRENSALRDSLKFYRSTISEDEYMNSRRVEKIKYYIRITERRPANKKFFFGWIKRTVQ